MKFDSKTALADEIGITKQLLSYRVKQLNIDIDLGDVTDDQVKMLKEYGKKVKSVKGKKRKNKNSDFTLYFTEIDRLKLENDQLHSEIRELHQLLNQSQQLQMKQNEKVELLESENQELINKKKPWFKRLFS